MLLTLAIETSNPSADPPDGPGPGAALGVVHEDGRVEVLGVERLQRVSRDRDDLLACIDRVVRAGGNSPRQIGLVIVSIGPGGYTSLRSSISAGKMIALGAGARCAGIASASVVALGTVRGGHDGGFAVALAGKGDRAYITRFDAHARALGEGAMLGPEAMGTLGVTRLIADEHLPGALRDAASEAGITIIAPVFDPCACLRAGASAPRVEPSALVPLYAREPEAVTLWRAKKS